MTAIESTSVTPARSHRPIRSAALIALLLGSATLSAHVVRGVIFPTQATAFVSSPSGALDAPVRLAWGAQDTGLRVVCFSAANTSPPRPEAPAWPRVTAVGFELPGEPRGFSLVSPASHEWAIVEQQKVGIPGRGTVTLDLALVTRVNPVGWSKRGPLNPPGIPPGQPAVRGSGTRFCVSGPFPDTLPDPTGAEEPVPATIELLLNGVVVGFQRVEGHGPSRDLGLWIDPGRTVPLYPPQP
jgi:hypothetical protein